MNLYLISDLVRVQFSKYETRKITESNHRATIKLQNRENFRFTQIFKIKFLPKFGICIPSLPRNFKYAR